MASSSDEFSTNHVGMAVPDLEAAIEWYRRVFEFKVMGRFGEPEFKAAFIQRDGILLEVFQPTPPPENEPAAPLTQADLTPSVLKLGYTHIAFGVADVDVTWEEAVSHGAAAVLPPTTQESGGVRSRFGYVGDLNRNLIELIHTEHNPQPK